MGRGRSLQGFAWGWMSNSSNTSLHHCYAAALQSKSSIIKRLSIDQMTHRLAPPVSINDIHLLQCFCYPYCPAGTTASINWTLPVCSQGGVAKGYPEGMGTRQGRRGAISPASPWANVQTHLHSQWTEPPHLQMGGHQSTKPSNLWFSVLNRKNLEWPWWSEHFCFDFQDLCCLNLFILCLAPWLD